MDAKPKVSPLSPAESDWVAEHLRHAERFVAEHAPIAGNEPLSMDVLERAYEAWLATNTTDSAQVNAVINAVGIAFGSLLVAQSGFQWVIASDDYGTDLALLALPGTADVLVFPANLIAKRWERRESGFLVSLFESISRQTVELADAWSKRAPGR